MGRGESAAPVAVWGVLNVTPDSFSDGGRHYDPAAAVPHAPALAHAAAMRAEGADVIDVGGESSRPAGATYGEGAARVSADEELRRVLPVVERLARDGGQVSIDTVKTEVAAAALAAGATIVNDVSGGADPGLLEAVAEHGAELVLMHNRGRGEVAGAQIAYGDVASDVLRELGRAVERAVGAGIPRERIWLDPGIGFAKTARQSIALLASVRRFVETGHRVLVGPSRKSFIGAVAPDPEGRTPPPDARLGGTAAAVVLAVIGGAHAVRVHDVREMRQAVRVAEAALEAVP